MTKSSTAALEHLVSRLREQAIALTTLRAAVDVQFARIASMQAKLDALPHARQRRQALRLLFAQPPPCTNRGDVSF